MISHKTHPLLYETIWFDKYKFDEAEKQFQECKAKKKQKVPEKNDSVPVTSLVDEIASAREHIKNTLKTVETSSFSPSENLLEMKSKIDFLMDENQKLHNSLRTVMDAVADVKKLKEDYAKLRVDLENLKKNPMKMVQEPQAEKNLPEEAEAKIECNGDDDDDIDLFGSDEEDEQTLKLREERLKAYENKKAKKAPVQAKSLVVLDVKPWNDETDLKEMEKHVREVQVDGLSWKASKLVPVAYGIKALQIAAVVEDEKVSIDWLQETLQEIEDYVQSVDIAAFNKL